MADDPSTQVDEEGLAIRMMEGDQSALREVLELYGGRVRGWLHKRFSSVLQEGEINEAFNTASYRLWQSAGTFDKTQGSLGGWFLRIAQRAAQDILRREGKYQKRHADHDPAQDPAGECPDPADDPAPDRQTTKG